MITILALASLGAIIVGLFNRYLRPPTMPQSWWDEFERRNGQRGWEDGPRYRLRSEIRKQLDEGTQN